MLVNTEGFLKYSLIYFGKIAGLCDPTRYHQEFASATSKSTSKFTVVIEAGITTDENLVLLEQRGYDYVCVSRKGNIIMQ